jgi:hypothetical protein
MHDPELVRHTAHNTFLAGLALASGDEELANHYFDTMMPAWALGKPLDVEVVCENPTALKHQLVVSRVHQRTINRMILRGE